MAIKITGGNEYRISLNTGDSKKTVRSVLLGATPTTNVNVEYSGNGVFKLADLMDVDSTDVDNNEVVVWDEEQAKYVIKTLPVLNGGEF